MELQNLPTAHINLIVNSFRPGKQLLANIDGL